MTEIRTCLNRSTHWLGAARRIFRERLGMTGQRYPPRRLSETTSRICSRSNVVRAALADLHRADRNPSAVENFRPSRLSTRQPASMAAVVLKLGPIESFEVEARASSWRCRCLQFLKTFESRGFWFRLTLIPLFNRLKQRYAWASRTEPVAINWPIFALGGSPMGTPRADRCSRLMLLSEPLISLTLPLLQQLKDLGWPAFS